MACESDAVDLMRKYSEFIECDVVLFNFVFNDAMYMLFGM